MLKPAQVSPCQRVEYGSDEVDLEHGRKTRTQGLGLHRTTGRTRSSKREDSGPRRRALLGRERRAPRRGGNYWPPKGSARGSVCLPKLWRRSARASHSRPDFSHIIAAERARVA